MAFSRRAFLIATSAASAPAAGGSRHSARMSTKPHVVLLGDSVFDNAAYVQGGPDVIGHLRAQLPSGWQATLLAMDGSVIASIASQLDLLPMETTHLVISVGGNDALRYSAVLDEPSISVSESLLQLANVRERFQLEYRPMLDSALERGLPTTVCTIYDPRFPDSGERRISITALSLINDCIIREAVSRGIPIIDLRAVCDEDADFANSIEPSVRGGRKIGAAIAAVVVQHDFSRGRSEVFTR